MLPAGKTRAHSQLQTFGIPPLWPWMKKKTKKTKHFEVFQLEKRELIPSFKLLVFRGLG